MDAFYSISHKVLHILSRDGAPSARVADFNRQKLGNTAQPEKPCADCLLQPGKQKSEECLQGPLYPYPHGSFRKKPP